MDRAWRMIVEVLVLGAGGATVGLIAAAIMTAPGGVRHASWGDYAAAGATGGLIAGLLKSLHTRASDGE